jgi:murein DD-endopeptidase MepM/ murein hydrolase activator NlpD
MTPRKWSGAFVLPVDGQPTSNFGTRVFQRSAPQSPPASIFSARPAHHPRRQPRRGGAGQPLYFTGNTVVIDYGGGLYSLYAHLSEFRTREGDTVSPDTVVGLVGATGRVTGPHLHWGVWLQGAHVDPIALVHATR